ncbi:MAG TPA: YihA family ribosome biogenesis GTP-binding protein [Flavobacteriales bacterium]|nr:YihA family ribosome biogenesis GTP-binding protein [Flavobacteriales bacterium]HIO67792.1 YihA family ribosome biogenesis GTP-binding protein [Flavobacteriales bacterium]
MKINTATFVISAVNIAGCPKPTLPEYAFIGRSNVGKSSLINALTGRNKLAKISNTPGKTRLINHFLINDNWYLVDLPGYGYARISKKDRAAWGKMSEEYILNRPNLLTVFLLIDSRHAPQKSDLEFIEWMGGNEIPFSMVYTKTDKLSKRELSDNLESYQAVLNEVWEELPTAFVTSSAKKQGLEEVLSFIENTNKLFSKS